MREIRSKGNPYLEKLLYGDGSWYYSRDYPSGDLYEAEEIFSDGRIPSGTTLLLISYPDGTVYEPLPKEEGVVIEDPIYSEGAVCILSVDFPKGLIRIHRLDTQTKRTDMLLELPLSEVKDCYNLKIHGDPLILTRQGKEDVLDIIWPKKGSIKMDPHDSFFLRNGDKLVFASWQEDPDYRSEIVIRDLEGNELSRMDGDIWVMPNGEWWHLGGNEKEDAVDV